MQLLAMLAFFVGCSSYDPSNPWTRFEMTEETARDVNQYEDEDLKCLVADYENARNKDKLCAAVRTK